MATPRFRDLLSRFQPYEWEPSNKEIAKRAGIREEDVVRFDTSTSPSVPEHWLDEVGKRLKSLRINDYPDASYSSLREALAEYLNLDSDMIIVTNGSDEGLDMVSKAFLEPGLKALTSTPTYSLYRIVTEVMGARLVGVPRREGFDDDWDGMIRAIDSTTGLVFLCSPNNPTGNLVDRLRLEDLLSKVKCGVLVDEAYYEFSGKSVVDLTLSYENLMVLRTFSKAFCMAGARVGYLIASKETIKWLNKVRPPNSVTVFSLALAEVALMHRDEVMKMAKEAREERERCAKILGEIEGIRVYESEANFLLVQLEEKDAGEVHRLLLNRGLVVRWLRDVPSLENCLRIGVRRPEDDDRLISALREILRS